MRDLFGRPMHWIEVDGKPEPVEDVLAWARYFETADRHVGDTTIDGVRISTVFLGVDYNFGPAGPPLLYETMAFGAPDNDDRMRRYATRAEAQAGHEEVCAEIQRLLGLLH